MSAWPEPTVEEILADAPEDQETIEGEAVDGVDDEEQDGVPVTRLLLWAGPPAAIAVGFGLAAVSRWLLIAFAVILLLIALAWLRRDLLVAWLRGESGSERRAARYAGRAAAAESRGRGESRSKQRAARRAARAQAMSSAVDRPGRGQRKAARQAGREAARATKAAGGSRKQQRAARRAAKAKAMGTGARPSTKRPSRKATRAAARTAGRAAAQKAKGQGASRKQQRAAKAKAKRAERAKAKRANRAKPTKGRGPSNRAKTAKGRGPTNRAKSEGFGPKKAKPVTERDKAKAAKKLIKAKARAERKAAKARAREERKADKRAAKADRPRRDLGPFARRTAARIGNGWAAFSRYLVFPIDYVIDETTGVAEWFLERAEAKAAKAARAEAVEEARARRAEADAEAEAARPARRSTPPPPPSVPAGAGPRVKPVKVPRAGTAPTTTSAPAPGGKAMFEELIDKSTPESLTRTLQSAADAARAEAGRKQDLANELLARAGQLDGKKAYETQVGEHREEAARLEEDAEAALVWASEYQADADAAASGDLAVVLEPAS